MTVGWSGRQLLLARAVLSVAGIVILVPAIAVVLSLGTGGPLDPVGPWVRDARSAVQRTDRVLAEVRRSLDAAAATLDDTTAAASDTAEMTDALGRAMNGLADASSVQVLGIQPFADLSPQFAELAKRAASVAASLRSTAGGLGGVRTDLQTLTARVADLETLARQLGPAGSPAGHGVWLLTVARVLTALLLAWLAGSSALAFFEARAGLRAMG